jgi:hypothetical protein
MLGTIAAAEGGNEAKNWIWNLELLISFFGEQSKNVWTTSVGCSPT